MRCSICSGSGRVMGLGFIFKDCDCDDGVVKAKKPVSIDKRSKSYKEAIDKLMEIHDCEREEAQRVFESEFDKIA